MSNQTFCNGDRVRHAGKPEWGIGTVTKVEPLPMNGQPSQRLSIRFPNAGVKTLVTGHSHPVLEHVNNESDDPLSNENPSSVAAWDKMNESGWLAPMAKRKVEEAMISLPQDVRDPFNSLTKRLGLMLGLYRFDRTGRGLIDWAVAQTGLDDPLTRFTRHELEERFDRWAFEREQYLAKMLQEVKTSVNGGGEPKLLQEAMRKAPAAAQDAVRRLTAAR